MARCCEIEPSVEVIAKKVGEGELDGYMAFCKVAPPGRADFGPPDGFGASSRDHFRAVRLKWNGKSGCYRFDEYWKISCRGGLYSNNSSWARVLSGNWGLTDEASVFPQEIKVTSVDTRFKSPWVNFCFPINGINFVGFDGGEAVFTTQNIWLGR